MVRISSFFPNYNTNCIFTNRYFLNKVSLEYLEHIRNLCDTQIYFCFTNSVYCIVYNSVNCIVYNSV